jgi:hypothetical protein
MNCSFASWPYFASVGVLVATGVYAVAVIYRWEQDLYRLRQVTQERNRTSSSHEELLNAALEEELPSDEVRERAWQVFLKNNSLA